MTAYYPDMACHLAPLKPGAAPAEDCECKVCLWLAGPDESVVPAYFSWGYAPDGRYTLLPHGAGSDRQTR